MRKRFFRLVEPTYDHKDPNYIFDIFIITLIILNVLAMIIGSDPSIGKKYRSFFYYFEIISVLIFTIEYIIRVWTCVEIKKYKNPITGRIRFMLTPYAIIDLLAIMPFYLPILGIDLRFLRILRIFRVFRLLKLTRYSRAFNMIRNVLKDKKEELLITMVFIVIILVCVSTIMYYIERDAQPEHFSSIPKALWWGVGTITTVGYGDVVPVTTIGKLLGGIITLIGIGLIALPSGIIASGYTEQIRKHREEKQDKKE